MRNWPYAYSTSLESEAIGDSFDVAPLPAGDAGTPVRPPLVAGTLAFPATLLILKPPLLSPAI